MPGFSVNDLMSSPGTTSNFVQGTSLSAGVGPPDGVPILPQSSQRVRDDNLEAYRNAMNVLDFIINHRGKAVETASPSPSYFQGFSPVDRSSRPDMMSRYYPPLHAPYPYGAIFSDAIAQSMRPYRKPKRIRTAFSPSQLLRLESAFEVNHYVVGQERKRLAESLALTETQVKVWFQNRRTKFKRLRLEEEEDDGSNQVRDEPEEKEIGACGSKSSCASKIDPSPASSSIATQGEFEDISMTSPHNEEGALNLSTASKPPCTSVSSTPASVSAVNPTSTDLENEQMLIHPLANLLAFQDGMRQLIQMQRTSTWKPPPKKQ